LQRRRQVKNSFIVELSEGQRKLRHLFLFNDVLVCAKYKASGKNEKFTFQLKWYIPLCQVRRRLHKRYIGTNVAVAGDLDLYKMSK
jgi:hypothetical protein